MIRYAGRIVPTAEYTAIRKTGIHPISSLRLISDRYIVRSVDAIVQENSSRRIPVDFVFFGYKIQLISVHCSSERHPKLNAKTHLDPLFRNSRITGEFG